MSDIEEMLEQVSEGIDIKATIQEAPESNSEGIINSPSAGRTGGKKKAALTQDSRGVLSSGTREEQPKKTASKKTTKPKEETVAVFSERNVVWQDVGKLSKGYNIIAKSMLNTWLQRPYVREATPEEVAREFGV